MVKEYMNSSFNIIPFKTIKLYFNSYNGGYLSKSLFLYNLIIRMKMNLQKKTFNDK